MNRLKPDTLRKTPPTTEQVEKIKRNPLYLVLDTITDTYNTGSLFRLADALGVTKMFLCGNMEYPPASRIHKAAVGTENWVPWEKAETTLEVIKRLQAQGVQVIAVEQDKRSVQLKDFKPTFPTALVVGNETTGVSRQVLDKVDVIVEFPMYGINNSFNVWGSAAIVGYRLTEYLEG